MKLTKTEQVFSAMFRKAVEEDLHITCPDKAIAENTRFQAYAFARKMRTKLAPDDELVFAIDSVSLSVEENILVARGKMKYEGLQAIMAQLGGEGGLVEWAGQTQEDREIEESSARMMEMLAGSPTEGAGATARPVNPYYTREVV